MGYFNMHLRVSPQLNVAAMAENLTCALLFNAIAMVGDQHGSDWVCAKVLLRNPRRAFFFSFLFSSICTQFSTNAFGKCNACSPTSVLTSHQLYSGERKSIWKLSSLEKLQVCTLKFCKLLCPSIKSEMQRIIRLHRKPSNTSSADK